MMAHLSLIYNVKDSQEDSLVLAIVRDEEAVMFGVLGVFHQTSVLTSILSMQHAGRGSLNFTVTEFDDYYIAFGNLNISFRLKMHCMIYSVQDVESKSSLYGVDVWKVKVSYIPHWITHFILWSTELCKQARQVSASQQEVVPLTIGEGNESLENLARESQSADLSPALGSENFQGGHGEQFLEHLCTVCLDAPKHSVFDTCGHRCTCYSCGMRIQNGDIARCPICQENVLAVRRIYDS
ncbi:unnamed protein product [Sphagnum jensenii]|uniref:RING-type domain-containing protein n=1 Tax=Sphagnum jensenii TaxID=128206 RepID=A0ABP1AYB6_9BRYO